MKRSLLPILGLVGLLGCLAAWFAFKNDPQKNAWRIRELAARRLAEHVAQVYPGRRALVVSNPFTQQKGVSAQILEMEEAGLRGLQSGFGSKVPVHKVLFPELKPEAQNNPRALLSGVETTTPLSYLVTEDAFDKLAGQYPGFDVIVSLVGLPADLSRVECWQRSGAPHFALLLPDLRVIGDTAAVRAALRSGKLAGFVLGKPNAPGSQSPPGGDFAAEFEKHFVLVTPDNFDQVLQSYPQLFARP